MKSTRSKTRRDAHSLSVTARSAQSSGITKCYVEQFDRPDGSPDLRFREKITKRLVRVLADPVTFHGLAPMSNLLQDSYAHGGGLVEPRSRKEHVAIIAPILAQDAQQVVVQFDGDLSVKVNISTDNIQSPPLSVWCYIEEYSAEEGTVGLRLRQKVTGRKVEMYGTSRDHLIKFLASPRLIGADTLMASLYEKDDYNDYVLVSGGTAVDSFDVLRFEDGAQLTYLLGPTPDTAYRDAFRVLQQESAATAHARTAAKHLKDGRYREAVLSARLAVEMACGGGGTRVKRRLAGAPQNVSGAGDALYTKRNDAVHEGGVRVEQQDAELAIKCMTVVLEYLEQASDPK